LAQDGPPEIFNTDQVAQFTSDSFTTILKEAGVVMSMDGKGRWVNNIFVERLWRSVKYEEVFLKAYDSPQETFRQLAQYVLFFNTERNQEGLNRFTPDRSGHWRIVLGRGDLMNRRISTHGTIRKTGTISP